MRQNYLKVHTQYIAEVKRKNGLEMQADRTTREVKYTCPPENAKAIEDALRYYKIL